MFCIYIIFLFVWTRCYYALCLSYHSKTKSVLFACLSPGWATTTGRLLGYKVENSIKRLSQGHSDTLPHRESNQGFAIFRLLARRSTNGATSPQVILIIKTRYFKNKLLGNSLFAYKQILWKMQRSKNCVLIYFLPTCQFNLEQRNKSSSLTK